MGGRVAVRLRDAGHRVLGCDVRAGRAAELDLEPVELDAVAAADAVFLSLPDTSTIESVVAVLPRRPGLVVVDLSTAEPASTRRLAAQLAADGVVLVDAGVSGGPLAAEAGTLTIMTGGPRDALERVRPLPDAFAVRVFHPGAVGNGHAAKAVNNFLNGVNLAAAAEAFVVGERAGLDPKLLLEVVNASSGRNWATENRFPRILEGDFIEGGLSNALMTKDLEIYVNLARREAGRTSGIALSAWQL